MEAPEKLGVDNGIEFEVEVLTSDGHNPWL
jgi:hypothetical protein